MDEQDGKKDTPEENDPSRLVTDLDKKVNDAEKEDRSGQSNSGQTDYCIWGLPWPQFVSATIAFLALIAVIGTAGLRWYADLLSQGLVKQSQGLIKQKERARVDLSDIRDLKIDPDPDLSFSLIFKNVGETTALNTYGTRLQGECKYTSSQECVQWCLQPLRKTQGDRYGHLVPQDEYKEEVFYTLKTGRARKKQRPIYFCGYFAYTDVFCVWRRQFYVLSYDPSAELLSTHSLGDDEEEARAQNCSQ